MRKSEKQGGSRQCANDSVIKFRGEGEGDIPRTRARETQCHFHESRRNGRMQTLTPHTTATSRCFWRETRGAGEARPCVPANFVLFLLLPLSLGFTLYGSARPSRNSSRGKRPGGAQAFVKTGMWTVTFASTRNFVP
ncbi:hypothetical protein DM02DRAFT_30323 [Periconia macrospinosa]|uniref:Transmembrane protein n=1 Tax=Periconia macrospinosa TaxID=97972 RepID=A0A2V1DKU4_9PLEO|nr:hypothetical protein DM02DRAFT_30323 [Periconia macrospinosa]